MAFQRYIFVQHHKLEKSSLKEFTKESLRSALDAHLGKGSLRVRSLVAQQVAQETTGLGDLLLR